MLDPQSQLETIRPDQQAISQVNKSLIEFMTGRTKVMNLVIEEELSSDELVGFAPHTVVTYVTHIPEPSDGG